LGLLGISTDITDRKQAERALIIREKQLAESQRMAHIGSWEHNLTTGEVIWSDELFRILGLDPCVDPADVNEFFRMIHPDDQPAMKKAIEETVATGKQFKIDYRINLPDGKTKVLLAQAELRHDETGMQNILCGTGQDITDRKEAEEKIKKSEAKYHNLFESSTDSLYLIDLNGNIIDANTTAYVSLGYSKEELLSLPLSKLDHPTYSSQNPERFAQVCEQGAAVFESAHLRKDGTIMPVEVNTRLIEYEGATVYFGVVRDITERKQASEKLLRVMREQSVILDNSPVGICLLVDRRFVWANEKMAEIFCCPKSELIGDTARKIYPSQEAYEQLGKDAYPEIAQGREYVTVQKLVRGDGSQIWGRYNGRAVDPSDLGKGTIWIFEDITERKQAEEQQSQYSAIITSSTDAIISKTLDGVVTSWNPAAEKMFGYTQHEMLGQSMALLMPPDRPDEETHILDRIKHGENIEHYETTRIRKNGEVFPVSVTISPIIDKSGTIIGASKFVRDISERKRVEQEKHTLEQQLLHAQKMESLGVLAGGIAHDFNNILAIIVGHCSLAEMDAKKAIDHIPKIEKAAQRAAGLCRQMLSYAGKEQFIQKEVNMGELVSDIVTMLKATINQNVIINENLVTDLPVVKADVNQIRQVVINLIINASEAIGNAQGEVNVALTMISVISEHQEKDHLGKSIPLGCYACLEVTDNGCGMSEENKQRIFEPFYTTKFTGRGLGMSAVLGIITAHKGTLQLFSEQGEGTTFKVYLPIQADDCTGVISLQQEILSEPWQGRGTVLLVEDEVAIMPIARAMLEMLGFSIIEAYNGKEALELYQKYSADITLIITDLGMPVMDGYALIRELNKLSPTLPIVVSSGFGEASVRERVTSDCIVGVVNKPYNYDQLRDLLKNVMEGSRESNC
jgi:PAS domain S-box-containing protein